MRWSAHARARTTATTRRPRPSSRGHDGPVASRALGEEDEGDQRQHRQGARHQTHAVRAVWEEVEADGGGPSGRHHVPLLPPVDGRARQNLAVHGRLPPVIGVLTDHENGLALSLAEGDLASCR
jgi:hypothetical protein